MNPALSFPCFRAEAVERSGSAAVEKSDIDIYRFARPPFERSGGFLDQRLIKRFRGFLLEMRRSVILPENGLFLF
jgi:hypothetical protein